ncbi:MAG: CarD family transcriptional regulator [Oscillospiraceae bacterium]
MLTVGQTVVYGTQGVCTVKEISMLKLGKTKGEYYALSPIDDPGSTVYVPTANEKLMSKLRPVLTGEEADALITEAVREPLEWIESDAERKSACDDIVKNGDRKQLMRLVGMLYRRRELLKDQKKHFHNVDAQYLKTAERMLHGELAYALGIAVDDVADYIRSFSEVSSEAN